jgi:chromosomal replication initiator protein
MTYIDLGLVGYSLGTSSFRIGPAKRLTVKRIQQVAADYYEIPVEWLRMRECGPHARQIRQTVMYVARHMTGMSYPELARRFGGLDHTTVIHAVNAVGKRLARSEDLAEDIAAIRREVERGESAPVYLHSFAQSGVVAG